mmetsp:Transcript_15743/g.23194  ORF Transcript_15743/g.23194 Transcript_15743/m.23194 type:complete len:88 (+) Transcript_15743:134-397(+)
MNLPGYPNSSTYHGRTEAKFPKAGELETRTTILFHSAIICPRVVCVPAAANYLSWEMTAPVGAATKTTDAPISGGTDNIVVQLYSEQ